MDQMTCLASMAMKVNLAIDAASETQLLARQMERQRGNNCTTESIYRYLYLGRWAGQWMLMIFGHATNQLKHLGQFAVALMVVQLPEEEKREEEYKYNEGEERGKFASK